MIAALLPPLLPPSIAIVQPDARHRHAQPTPTVVSATPVPIPSGIAYTSAPIACAATIVNGNPLPACVATSFFPEVMPNDVYRRIIPITAATDASSSIMIASNFGTKTGNTLDDISGLVFFNGISNYTYASGRPLYIARTTDPLVNVSCTMYCIQGNAVIYLPAAAMPEGSSDRHLSVLQPDNTVVDTWLWGPIVAPFFPGEIVSAATVFTSTVGGTPYSNADIEPAFGIDTATAGGMVSNSGAILLSELQAKYIGHELYGLLPCFAPNWYPPATQDSTTCGIGKVGIPLGALLQYMPSDATIASSNMTPVEKTILTAAHDYGVRMADSAGIPSLGLQVESQDPFWAMGSGVDPYSTFALSAGFHHVTNASANPPLDEYRWDITDASLPTDWRVLTSGN